MKGAKGGQNDKWKELNGKTNGNIYRNGTFYFVIFHHFREFGNGTKEIVEKQINFIKKRLQQQQQHKKRTSN